ncbi:C40 family peptidase [Brevibacillus dissolubilis]|uniref:C40 family peptidase n=1 Tax=Brevibacillus dissolubilis TaxID=1844116 RepID=UPI00210044A2|nr:C40 family peptidase [Brevibacillus dissolubilis]
MKKLNMFKKATATLMIATSLFAFGNVGMAASADEYDAVGQKIVDAGEKYLGTPYKYASSRDTKTTMDCSEFTMWAYMEGAGIELGRSGARSQYKKGEYVKRSDLKVGDLVFFSTKKTMKYSSDSIKRIGHVGIYAGDGKVLHTYGKGGVKYSDMNDGGWWDDHYVKAVRIR